MASKSDTQPPRERILEAACELFYRHGVSAVGVQAIAEAAHTNKMSLYRHYGSKDELIVAYVTQLAKEGEAIWQRLENDYPDEPEKRLEAWVDYLEDVLTNRFDRGCALANAAVELPAEHPARRVIEDFKTRKRENLVALFSAAHFKDAESLADEVFLMFEGARISLQCGTKITAPRIMSVLRALLSSAPKASAKSSRRKRS